jgi:hypothetical protein
MHRSLVAAVRNAGAVSLGALGALHVLWAAGSAWPAADRATLAAAVGGFTKFPGARACLTVAAALGAASTAVSGLPEPFEAAGRAASATAAAVLAARGLVGLAGRMPNARRSASFAALDRRVYSPLCLALALGAAAGVARADR